MTILTTSVSRSMLGRVLAILLAVVLFQSTAGQLVQPLAAQGIVSVGAGAGTGIGNRNSDSSGTGTHGALYVQARIPVIPFALRADALFTKTRQNGNAMSLLADAVVIAPIPFVQPYVLAGYGRYGVGKDSAVSGWNAGVGARVRTPWVAIYVEGRRHKQILRDLLTIGISR